MIFIFVPFNCPPKCPWEIFYISDFTTSPIKVHMGSVRRTITLRKNIFVTNLRQTSHQIHYFPFRSKWNYVDLHENITLFLMPGRYLLLFRLVKSFYNFSILENTDMWILTLHIHSIISFNWLKNNWNTVNLEISATLDVSSPFFSTAARPPNNFT